MRQRTANISDQVPLRSESRVVGRPSVCCLVLLGMFLLGWWLACVVAVQWLTDVVPCGAMSLVKQTHRFTSLYHQPIACDIMRLLMRAGWPMFPYQMVAASFPVLIGPFLGRR